MIRTVSRRLSRLEERAAIAEKDRSISIRIRLVDPEEGCTGVLLLEPGKPITQVPPTPVDIEEIRARSRTPPGCSAAMEGSRH